MTYERGEGSREYKFDIFNPEGIFVGRKSLKVSQNILTDRPNRKIKNDHIYCIEEKESGFRQVVVYKMNWE